MPFAPCRATALLAALTAALPAQNLLVDGDLEGHSAAGCTYNQSISQFNGLYANAHSFGAYSGIDIMQGSCYGSPAHSGSTKLGLSWNNSTFGDKDAMALDLVAPLQSGVTYGLSLWAEHLPFGTIEEFDIGVSGVATAFGTTVYSATAGNGWSHFTTTFTAPFGAAFLTVRCQSGPDTWIAFDDFDLQRLPTLGVNTAFGAACGGLVLTGVTRPVIGSSWNFALTSIPATATLGLVLIDFYNPGVAVGPQAPGCTRYSGGLMLALLPLPVGSPAVTLPLPLAAWLVGIQMYAQCAAIVPGLNPLGIAASNGVQGLIGDV